MYRSTKKRQMALPEAMQSWIERQLRLHTRLHLHILKKESALKRLKRYEAYKQTENQTHAIWSSFYPYCSIEDMPCRIRIR